MPSLICNKLYVWIVLVAAVLSLTACGFRLRGAATFPTEYKTVQLQGTAEFSQLGKSFKQYLASAGLKLVKQPDADIILTVRRDQVKRRVLSVTSSGAASEYELLYDLSVSASDKSGNSLTPDINISLIRHFSFDQDNVLAKTDEQSGLQNQMQQLAIQRVIRQLSTALTRKQETISEKNPVDIEKVQTDETK